MKTNRWYKSGKSLLKEIAGSAPDTNTMYIWYMGQHGFVINLEGTVIYIDVILNPLCGKDGKDRRNYPPPFGPDAIQRADYYICTHNHSDHLNLQTIVPLAKANPGTKFIVPKPWVRLLAGAGIEKARIMGACAQQPLEAGKIEILPVPAFHTRYIQDEGVKDKNGDYTDLGYVIRTGALSVYHSGDTWINPELVSVLKELGPFNAAMLPVNGADWERTARGCIGNVSAMDAVKLAMEVPVDLVIPSHYDMMPGNTENPAYFADCFYRLCPQKRFHICALGERFIYMK
ncbi:MAG: MBL fold metallo-hydrolase [Treponema sp.]|nr:MBL fold metallo-hydrolase [Treponema sp.]